jgi:hypothetical protein
VGLRDLAAVLTGTGAQQPTGAQERGLTLPWQMLDALRYGGSTYLLNGGQTYGKDEEPRLAGERNALTSNGTVYGIVRSRVDLFSQARFVWKRYGAGPKPMASDVFTDATLAPLDNPARILEWCELDVATAGNSYWVLDAGRLRRLHPEWVTIVLGSQRDPDDPGAAWDAEPVGLVYQPRHLNRDAAEVFMWSEVAHYAPERDPDARFRGMSYLRPAMEDVESDNGARRYLTKFWQNNATAPLFITYPPEVLIETVKVAKELWDEAHKGVERSWKTAFLGAGGDPKVVGSTLKDLDTEAVRKQVHLDITLSAGVPPIAAGIFEGTYANAKESNRALADKKLRYLWLRAVEAFRPMFPGPTNAELWYDVSGVSALQSDALDDSAVMAQQANTMRTLVDGGFEPSSVTAAVTSGDMTKLVHSGNLSVQLLPAGQAPGSGDQGETRNP